MKPMLHAVVAKLRAGKLPTVLEYGSLLHEAGCDQSEARWMTAAYAKDLAGNSSAEDADEIMASLRSFTLGLH